MIVNLKRSAVLIRILFLTDMTEVSEADFDVHLDDEHDDVYIGEHSYPASRVLKIVDPDAYQHEKKKYEQDE